MGIIEDAISQAYQGVAAAFDGLEIFMMNVGNADCFLVIRHRAGGGKEVTLVDGGKKSDSESIIGTIKDLGISHIDYVVNTHPHDDHAGGLVEIIQDTTLTFGQMWMHAAWTHINPDAIRIALGRNSTKWVLDKFTNSLTTQMELFNACAARKIPVYEPFAGGTIGPFNVIGPTLEFYLSCLDKFNDLESVTQWNDYLENRRLNQLYPTMQESSQTEGQLEDITSPENESSVIMALEYGSQKFLFCGDAGCDAFGDVIDHQEHDQLRNVHWMQAPHHGSRRNLWPEMIEWMNPDEVWMSCEGSKKHPSVKLVNYFSNKCQAKVYASYYPKPTSRAWIRLSRGNVPSRNTSPVPSLYNAK